MQDSSHRNALAAGAKESRPETSEAAPRWMLDLPASIPRNGVVLAVCGLLALGCIRQAGLAGLDWNWMSFWNDVRLSRAYAVTGGADLYGSETEGVLAGHLYGPVGFFLYAPVRLAERPETAIRIGIAISGLLVIIPFAFALLSAVADPVPRGAILAIAFFHLYWSDAAMGAWIIHVDAPAFGLVLLSFGALARAVRSEDSRKWLWVTAAAAAGAAWAKQTTVPALILPAVFLWLGGRKRDALQTLSLTVAFGAALGVLFGAMYGFGDLWFTMFEIPSRHPRTPGVLLMDHWVFRAFVDLMPLAVVALLVGGRAGESRSISPAYMAAGYAFALGLFSIVGRIKEGGAANNYLGLDVFLTLCLCLFVANGLGRPGALVRPTLAALGLLVAIQAVRTTHFLAHDHYRRSHQPETGGSEEAFEFLLKHPGEAYFPWNPLAMQMATGELYHSGHGILTRRQGGRPVGDEQWRAHVPTGARFLATPYKAKSYLLEKMPEYSRQVEHPELERWSVWERAELR